MVFDRVGVTAGDLAWIRRDQFVYFVELERAGSDPSDWTRFREAMYAAVVAACGLDHLDGPSVDARMAGPSETTRRRALQVLDVVRARHDPAADWPGFLDGVYRALVSDAEG